MVVCRHTRALVVCLSTVVMSEPWCSVAGSLGLTLLYLCTLLTMCPSPQANSALSPVVRPHLAPDLGSYCCQSPSPGPDTFSPESPPSGLPSSLSPEALSGASGGLSFMVNWFCSE